MKDSAPVWQSADLALKPGRNSLRHGVTTDFSSFRWRNYPLVAESRQPDASDSLIEYDQVAVHFLNDLSDGDGDRNLYVEWVKVNGKVHWAFNGKQTSQCVPDNPYDAGYLYCGGQLVIAHDAGSMTAQKQKNGFNVIDGAELKAGQVFLNYANPAENLSLIHI